MGITKVVKPLKKLLPKTWRFFIIDAINTYKNRKFRNKLQSDIIAFYSKKEDVSFEENEVIAYLNNYPITVFPYDFQNKYNKEAIEVFLDPANGLHFVVHDAKKLYFKRSLKPQQIQSLYHGLLLDQDENSPHLYLTADFNLNSSDVIADIGSAEGNFSLTNVDKVKKIYLFEYDPEWIEALNETFKPWADKVVICDKFVSDTNTATSISLDRFAETNSDITFLKVDIEGEEENFLKGAQKFIKTKSNLKIAICTYHKQQDQEKFTTLLENSQFKVSHSKRFMIFLFDSKIKAPFLRRGLLRAQKHSIQNG